MSKKNQNYFQALELADRDNDSDDVDFPVSYLASNSKTKPVPQSKKSIKQKFTVFDLQQQFKDQDANQIQFKIKNVQQINWNNYDSVVLKALANALQKNRKVHTIKLTLGEYTVLPFTSEDAAFYQEILSNARINFHVSAYGPGLYSQICILTGSSCAKNISHLDVLDINTTMLDELLADLNEEKIVDIRISRLDTRDEEKSSPMLKNLARFGGFQQLNHLKIQVHDSECDQLLQELQNIKTLSTLDLSESTFTEESTLLLTDLIAKQNMLTTLRLAKCKVGKNFLSMVFKAVLSNLTIQNLDISEVEPFRYIDPSIVGEITNKKKLKTLASSTFDTIMTKLFSVDHLILVGSNYEALKSSGPEMYKLTLRSRICFDELQITSSITAEDIKDLFAALNSNSWIDSVVFESELADSSAADELMDQLKSNRTLKKVEMWNLPPLGLWAHLRWYQFVEVIETNDTLEEFICHDKIPQPNYRTTYNILRALSNSKSMTKIGLHPLVGPINDFKQMLTENPRISFIDDSNWPLTRKMPPEDVKIREEVIALNERNKQNAKKRLLRIKMNVATLARSYLSPKVPMEIWKEIFMYVDARMHYFALFNSFLDRK